MHDFALASNILADRHFLLHEQMTVSHLGKKISFGQEQEVGTSPLPFSQYRDLRGAVALRQITHVHRGLPYRSSHERTSEGHHRQPTPQTAAL